MPSATFLPGIVVTASIALSVLLGGCASVADAVDAVANTTAMDRALEPGPDAQVLHGQLMVADLHADTLLWRRGISATEVRRGHVDLVRMGRGNVGLQGFTIPTRVPIGLSCIAGSNPDPAGLLATVNGWPGETHASPYHRALHQADALAAAAERSSTAEGPRLVVIRSVADLHTWKHRRFPASGVVDRSRIGAILGLEGSHALNDRVGEEFEELYRRGLRMIAPTHRFDNAFGGSSEGCRQYGLTELGKHLVKAAIAKGMIIDLAHASSGALMEAIVIASQHRQPVVVSHSGLKSFLEQLPAGKNGHLARATSDQELLAVAQTGGVFGVGFWKEVIGTADVDHIVGTIRQAREVLRKHEGKVPTAPGWRVIERASQHIGLGSDWDGAVETAVHSGQIGLITEGLMKADFSRDEIAEIMGRNVCRVVAQSLREPLAFWPAQQLCTH